MSGKLIIKAVTKFTVGILLVGLLLFVPAGTFRYPGAWLFMGSLFIPMPLVLGSLISFFILYCMTYFMGGNRNCRNSITMKNTFR